MNRPDMAIVALLMLSLAWIALGYWVEFTSVGDAPGAALDALAPTIDFSNLPPADRPDRDYSGDRGPCPQPRPRFASLYDELVARFGVDPLGG